MNTVYDLLLNFSDVVYDFYEWNIKDDIEHIKKIPFVKISTKTLYDFLKKDIKIDINFLKEIENVTQKYDLTKLEYACIFTDGITTLAVEFSKDGYSMYKSRLQLEDEEEIIRYVKRDNIREIGYEVVSNDEENPRFLSRKEIRIKNFLEKEITKTYQNKEYSKLEYLYLEYFDVLEENPDLMKERLLDSMKQEIDERHYTLYELLLLFSKKKKLNN